MPPPKFKLDILAEIRRNNKPSNGNKFIKDIKQPIKLTLDLAKQPKKPTKEQVAAISNRLVKHYTIELETLGKVLVAPYSVTFCPGVFRRKRRNSDWSLQQLFALDFDDNTPPETIIERSYELGLIPNIVYTSFSDTPEHRKFRVIYACNIATMDRDKVARIQKSLLLCFPEADKACKDPARLYFGGKELIHSDYETLNSVNGIREIVEPYMVEQENKVQAYRRAMPKDYTPSRSFKTIRQKVRILDDFMNLKRVRYIDLFGLLTNLRYIPNGLAMAKAVMHEYNREIRVDPYTDNHMNLLAWIASKEYLPTALENFSNYEEDWAYANLLNVPAEDRNEDTRNDDFFKSFKQTY